MTELRASIAVFLLLIASLMVIMNWSCIIEIARNRRNGIQKHVSTVPLISLIFAGLAHKIYPWTPKTWIAIIPASDIGNWMLIIGLPWTIWTIAKGMFKKGTPNKASEAASGSAPGTPPEAPQG